MFYKSLIVLSVLASCTCIYAPPNFGPQRYEIEEDPSRQTTAAYKPTYYNPKPAYDQNQFNQYYQGGQQSPTQQQNLHQYMSALQQFYAAAASRQPQPGTYPPASPSAPLQNYAQSPVAPNYAAPLGVLYSAASDVSQFQYSGNGVNYSF